MSRLLLASSASGTSVTGFLRNVATSMTFPPPKSTWAIPEAPTYDATIPKKGADVLGARAGADVEVLRRAVEEEVANTPSYEVGLIPGALQLADHAGGVDVDPLLELRIMANEARPDVPFVRFPRSALVGGWFYGEGGEVG